MIYDKERIYFSTEYERRNPATMTEGYNDYMKYLEEVKNKLAKPDGQKKDADSDNVREQLNNIAIKSVVQSNIAGLAGGNLLFTSGNH